MAEEAGRDSWLLSRRTSSRRRRRAVLSARAVRREESDDRDGVAVLFISLEPVEDASNEERSHSFRPRFYPLSLVSVFFAN